MGKCQRCGRGGLFFKVNELNLCLDCEVVEILESQEKKLKQSMNRLKTECSDEQALYDKIAEKAKVDVANELDDKIKEIDKII